MSRLACIFHDCSNSFSSTILHRVLLTTDEVKQYLESNGATDVIVLPLKQPIENIRHFVIASASSTRLVRQLGETIVRAVSYFLNFTL